MGHVAAVVNQKGGVGKTTTAVSVAALIAAAGHRCLLLDLDPQGNATSGLGIERRGLTACIYDALIGRLPLAEVVVPTRFRGLDLAPATLNLAGLEVELAAQPGGGGGWRERRLREAVEPLRRSYDLLLVDAPPSLGLLTVNALVAADGVLIPVQAEYFALEGLSQLLNSVRFVQRRLNPSLELDGVALTMLDPRTNLGRQVAGEVRGFFGERAFRTAIPRNVKLGEAPSYGEPIHVFAPDSAGAVAYRELSDEVMERSGLRRHGQGVAQ